MSSSGIEAVLFEELPLPAELPENEAGADGAVFEQALEGELERQGSDAGEETGLRPEPPELREEARPLRLALALAAPPSPSSASETVAAEPDEAAANSQTTRGALPARTEGEVRAAAPELEPPAPRIEAAERPGVATPPGAATSPGEATSAAEAPPPPVGDLEPEARLLRETELARAALEAETARRAARANGGETREPTPAPARVGDPPAPDDAARATPPRDVAAEAVPGGRPSARTTDAALPSLPESVAQGLEAARPPRAAQPTETARVAEPPAPPAPETAPRASLRAPEAPLPETILHREVNVAAPLPASGSAPEVTPATATAPASASRPTPADALPVHVEWLAERGGGSARLDLHPPHLGRVEIAVRVRGADVEVTIAAPESAAQVVVNGQRDTLAEALGARDLRLTHFEVGSGARDETGSDSSERHAGDGFARREPGSGAERAAVSTGFEAGRVSRAPQAGRSRERVDLHV